MSKPSRSTILKAIIKAYREKAFVVISLPVVYDSLTAKKNIRVFGPVTKATPRGKQTIYGYESTTEHISVLQYVNRTVGSPKKDAKKAQPSVVSAQRQKEIEKAIVEAYRNGAQFIIGFQPAKNQAAALENIRYFGKPVKSRTRDGRNSLVVDDISLQIDVTATIGYPK